MGLSSTSILATSLSILVYVVFKRRKRTSRQLPPMPPGELPLLGHALQMPQSHEWLKYLEWSEQLGMSRLVQLVYSDY